MSRVAAQEPVSPPDADRATDDVTHLLQVMTSARTAAPLVIELLTALGWPEGRFFDVLADAEAASLVSPWESRPAGFTVVLTDLASARLGLQLVGSDADVSSNGRFAFRFIPLEADPRPQGKQHRKADLLVGFESDLDGPSGPISLDAMADPRSLDGDGPSGLVGGSEWFETKLAAKDRAAWTAKDSRELLGTGHLPFVFLCGLRDRWDGEVFTGDCPSCETRSMGRLEFCFRGNRSGLDAILGPPPRPKPPKPERPPMPARAKAASKKARRRSRAKAIQATS